MSAIHDFQNDIIRMCGLQHRLVKRLVLTIEVDAAPVMEVTEEVLSSDAQPSERVYSFKLVDEA